jgi:transposase-like protein
MRMNVQAKSQRISEIKREFDAYKASIRPNPVKLSAHQKAISGEYCVFCGSEYMTEVISSDIDGHRKEIRYTCPICEE